MMSFLFDGWSSIGRSVAAGALAYIALVFMLRVSGKRTLAKMNAFDLVVTVALGSTLATIILSKDVPVAAGVAALGLLIAMQYLVAWLSVRSEMIAGAVRSEPRLLVRQGNFLKSAMKGERVTEQEVLAAIRNQGLANLSDVDAVILETDGTISVLPSVGASAGGMEPVRGYEGAIGE